MESTVKFIGKNCKKIFIFYSVVQITFVTIDYQTIEWNYFWFSKETSSEQFSKEPMS